MSHEDKSGLNLRELPWKRNSNKETNIFTKKNPCHTKQSVAKTCPQCAIRKKRFTHLHGAEQHNGMGDDRNGGLVEELIQVGGPSRASYLFDRPH